MRRVTGHSSASRPPIGQAAPPVSSDWFPAAMAPHMIPAMPDTDHCLWFSPGVESVCLMAATREQPRQ